jgi:hypothetical protein
VILVPLERGDGGGQNGTGYMVAVAVVVELWWLKKGEEKYEKMCVKK